MYMYTIFVKNFKSPCLSCINYFLWKNYLCRKYKKIKNNKTKLDKSYNLKKQNKLIQNKAKLGELIQINHLKIKLNILRMYEFNAIDPYTIILVFKLYLGSNSKNAKDFLINHLIPTFYYLKH